MDFKKSPSLQNKEMINYYENASEEDLSMLKEIGGDSYPGKNISGYSGNGLLDKSGETKKLMGPGVALASSYKNGIT